MSFKKIIQGTTFCTKFPTFLKNGVIAIAIDQSIVVLDLRLRKEKLKVENIPLSNSDSQHTGAYARTPRFLFLFDQEVKSDDSGEIFDDINYRNLTAIVNHGKDLKKIPLWSHF